MVSGIPGTHAHPETKYEKTPVDQVKEDNELGKEVTPVTKVEKSEEINSNQENLTNTSGEENKMEEQPKEYKPLDKAMGNNIDTSA